MVSFAPNRIKNSDSCNVQSYDYFNFLQDFYKKLTYCLYHKMKPGKYS